MKFLIVVFFVSTALLLLNNCNTTELPIVPPEDKVTNTILLKVEWQDLHRINVSWNKAKADTTTEQFTYLLTQTDEQGNKTTKQFTITDTDTSYIAGDQDSLQQGKNYKFFVEAYNKENKLKDTSKTVTGKTLTPTSHNITWQIDTLGQSGDFLYDVWGLDENNVWAVGAVTISGDRSGIIKWNGQDWETFPSFAASKQAVWGFDEQNIFVVGDFSNRGKVGHWNGSTWTEYDYNYFYARGDTVYPLTSVWGLSPDDVWAVGDKGTIVHWDGSEWNKVEGIDERYTLWDIWGFADDCVYAVGNKWNQEAVIFYYNGIQWIKERTFNSIGIRLSSIWGPYKGVLYFTDFQLYKIEGGMYDVFTLPDRIAVINKIRGYNTTSIFTVGDYGEIFHFNGNNWQKINLFQFPDPVILSGIKIFSSKVFIIGTSGDNKALILNVHIQ